MGKENKFGKMGQFFKENTILEWKMEKENIFGMINVNIKDNGKTI